MNSKGPSFDIMDGGNVEVASSFTLREFGTPRVEEILMLSEAINDPPAKGQLFQRLPKHMRRRQMSHHETRLPRKLRSSLTSQNKDPPSKRPSRKYRRKPSNLLNEYNRRQRNKIWLETHIWHAKRFKMVDRWGYRVAESSTNKGFRANYRAAKSHCLLMDISYFNCIELIGNETGIIDGLKQCSNPACGLTFAARAFIDGTREGSVFMYHPNSYPYKVIGNVSFLWKPKTTDLKRVIWLWAHPSYCEEIIECLCEVFHAVKTDFSVENVCTIPEWTSKNVKINLLKDKINRFRLIGPLSSYVLADALTLADMSKNIDSDESVMIVEESVVEISLCEMETDQKEEAKRKVEEGRSAVDRFYGEKKWQDNFKAQTVMAKRLASAPPDQFPVGVVFGLLIADPRLSFPGQRTKSIGNYQESRIPEWSVTLAQSVIWDPVLREAVTSNKLTDWQINQTRTEQAVPSLKTQNGTVIPLLLIQQPGCLGKTNSGFGAGWDIVMPSGWAMPVWRGLVLRGARTGALREKFLLNLEMESLRTALQPDSAAGREQVEQTKKTLEEKYFSRPPAKRPNFIKLGIEEPFSTPWSKLSEGEVFVVRDIRLLMRLADATVRRLRLDLKGDKKGLVAVSVRCYKGRPEPLARLYVPEEQDFEKLKLLEEPVHPDDKETDRKKNRKKHLQLLRKWRRDRKRAKSGREIKYPVEIVETAMKAAETLRRNSWLPEEHIATRGLAGYVTQADFRHSEGRGGALGYVTLKALLQALELGIICHKAPMLLLRNVRHTRYHMAEFKVLLD